MKPVFNQLLDAVNSINRIDPPMSEDQVTISNPTEIATPRSYWNTRSTIECTGLVGEALYVEPAIIRYHRIDLGHYFKGKTPKVQIIDGTSTRELADHLASIYELPITGEDILDEPLPLSVDYVPVTLKTNPTSLGFTGTLNLLFSSGPPRISDVVTNRNVDVMKLPYPGDPGDNNITVQSMMVYGWDCTDLQRQLLAVPSGTTVGYNHAWWTTLFPYLQSRGLYLTVYFTNGVVEHFQTTDPDVADYVNQDYTNVTRLTNYYNGGSLFFHWNESE